MRKNKGKGRAFARRQRLEQEKAASRKESYSSIYWIRLANKFAADPDFRKPSTTSVVSEAEVNQFVKENFKRKVTGNKRRKIARLIEGKK